MPLITNDEGRLVFLPNVDTSGEALVAPAAAAASAPRDDMSHLSAQQGLLLARHRNQGRRSRSSRSNSSRDGGSSISRRISSMRSSSKIRMAQAFEANATKQQSNQAAKLFDGGVSLEHKASSPPLQAPSLRRRSASPSARRASSPLKHNPTMFSHGSAGTVRCIARGLNIINAWSGQRVAAWIYQGVKRLDPGYATWKRPNAGWGPEPASKICADRDCLFQENDTVFVSTAKLVEFASDFLAAGGSRASTSDQHSSNKSAIRRGLTPRFVLISSQFGQGFPSDHHKGLENAARTIVNHPSIIHWFTLNPPGFAGGMHNHSKVSPFPLGLKPSIGRAGTMRDPVDQYRRAFLKQWHSTTSDTGQKDIDRRNIKLYTGPFQPTSAVRQRMLSALHQNKTLARRYYYAKHLDFGSYLNMLSRSQFVLSPDGLFPDCHRHYEAIGMGAVPVTMNDRRYYGHLVSGAGPPGIVYLGGSAGSDKAEFRTYNVTKDTRLDWTDLELLQRAIRERNTGERPNVNMVFEEYWMEHIERVVGLPLRWWDARRGIATTLPHFS